MEVLAKKLLKDVNRICVEYHYFKQTNVIEKVQEIHEEMQQYITFFLQGNILGIEDEEYTALSQYALQVLRDYSESYIHRDMVLMVDTLEYGLRDLLKLMTDTDDGGESNE